MKKLLKLFFVVAVILIFNIICYAGSVRGYYRKDGTYVQPHYRSDPNGTVRDNYNYKGNYNPYNGKIGNNYYRNNPSSEYYNPYYK